MIDRCAAQSLLRDDPVAGTASHCRTWLLLEHVGAWGERALRDARLPEGVGRGLERLARESRAKILLIRRFSSVPDGDGLRVFAAYADPDRPRLEAGRLTDPREALDLDLDGFRRGGSTGLPGHDGSLFLVCTNGRHDVCCAERGRPVAKALDRAHPDETWEVSHIGGDRFAANLVVLPHGLYYGRLDPQSAITVAGAHLAGELDLDHLRGRSSHPMPVQAAESFLRRDLGVSRIDDLGFVGRSTEDDTTVARFRVAGAIYDVGVRTLRDPATAARLTCKAARESPVPRHELVWLRKILMTDLDALAAVLPAGALITDADRMDKYCRDRANDPAATLPLAVVRATTTADVQAAMRWAAEQGVGVIPRGAGSGLSGGATAQAGCLVVATERMTAITVDPDTRTVAAEPGALNIDVKRAAAEHGLWYPPDPSSYEICSIGGNVATNAGGLCCVKYGVTSDYVLGLTVVLADGTAVGLGGPRLKDAAGLSLTKLFVGSEGTLGIVTGVLLRLVPAQRPPATLVATFGSLDAATEAVLAVCRGTRPSMVELMDRASINAVEDMTRMGLDRDAEALLLMQSDEAPPRAAQEIAELAEICTAHRATEVATTDDPEESAAFVAARRMVITAMETRGSLLLEDVGVPLPQLSALVSGIEEIATQHDVQIAVVAHAGDGNTHPLIVFDPADASQATRAAAAYGAIMELGISLGGTITGEHGVGRLKRAWLGDQLGPDVLDLSRRIKDALDPDGLLNPGAVF